MKEEPILVTQVQVMVLNIMVEAIYTVTGSYAAYSKYLVSKGEDNVLLNQD
jgi:hypothetical protein